MKPLTLLTLCFLLLTIFTYAIQGQWQSTDYNSSKITISAISTSPNGVNNYNLQVDACPVPVSFAILQSYLKVNNLGKATCNASGSASMLSSSLQQKFFYFQIYYDQLLFVNIYGNKTLSFVRVKPDMRNYHLSGVFASDDGTQVAITDKSIYLCNNSQQVDYSGNSKDAVRVVNQTLVESCPSNKSQEIYQKLKQAAYYRLENPSVLRLYGPNNSEVLELNKVGKWDGKVPEAKNASSNPTNSIQSNGTSLNNGNGSASSNNAINNNTSQATNSTNISNSTSSQPTSNPNTTLQNNLTNNNPSSSNLTSPPTNSSLQPSSSASLESTQSYINIKLTFSLATAVWYPQFFMVSDQSTWPTKIAINATTLVFIGCNTVSIPLVINYNTLAVTTGSNVFSSRKACGNVDQPYIELIKNATSVSSAANDTAFRLVFRGKNNSVLFAVSRNYTASQKKNLIYAATNPVTSQITLSVGSNQTNVSAPDAKNAIGTTQSQTSTSTSTATSTTSTTVSSSTSSAYPSYSSTYSSTTSATASASPTEVVATASNSSSPPVAVSTSLLVGRYNPHKIGGTALPAFLTQNIFFVFNPAFVFITGTCNSYVYAYNMQQKGTKTLFSLDIPNRQVKKNQACDSSNDLLYIQPFEQSQLLTLISSNSGDVAINFTDSAGNPTLSLNKINRKASA